MVYSSLFFFFALGAAYFNSPFDSQFINPIIFGFVCAVVCAQLVKADPAPRFVGDFWSRPLVFVFISVIVCSILLHTSYLLFQGNFVDRREVIGFGYLTTSDMLSLFFLCSMAAFFSRPLLFFLIATVGLFSLIIFGSRASFVAFVLSMFFFKFNVRFIIVPAIVMFVAVAFLASGSSSEIVQIMEDVLSGGWSRILRLIVGGGDASLEERIAFRQEFLRVLEERPGCFFLPCPVEGSGYVHDWLSLIQYFGVMAFFLFATFIVAFIFLIRLGSFRFVLPVFAFCILSIFFARAWIHIVFPVLLGLSIGIIYSGKGRKRGVGLS